jgi:hypothetical protein
MSRFKMSRRELLGAAAATTVAGLALARETPTIGPAGTSAVGRASAPAASGAPSAAGVVANSLAWLDGMLSGDDLAQARATLAPLQPTLLEPDLLWQWRRDLAQELGQKTGKGVRAIAITRWDKAFVLRGLAREAALPVRQQRISRSLFQTEIG